MLTPALASFANLVLHVEFPQSIKPIFFGDNLIPLNKKDGGIGPIAVGQALQCLVVKFVTLRVTHSIGSGLVPLQLGCGVPLRCKADAHAINLFLKSVLSNHLLL